MAHQNCQYCQAKNQRAPKINANTFCWNSIDKNSCKLLLSSFLKMGQPQLLFHLFSFFQTHVAIYTTNKCEKNVHPVYGAGI